MSRGLAMRHIALPIRRNLQPKKNREVFLDASRVFAYWLNGVMSGPTTLTPVAGSLSTKSFGSKQLDRHFPCRRGGESKLTRSRFDFGCQHAFCTIAVLDLGDLRARARWRRVGRLAWPLGLVHPACE